jgi:hypothetical protein
MVHRKQHMGNTVENEIKASDSLKAYKYLSVEKNHNIEHKNEKKG